MIKISCTVGIIVFNRAESLRKALESVVDFDEIIICDGGSTDGTLDVAKEFGCKVIEQDPKFKRSNNTIDDFSGVRNQTLIEARNEWFLFVDSDEYLSKESVEEIRSIVANDIPRFLVYDMPRKFVYKGKRVDCATTYPSYQTRFFNKKAVTSFRKKVHERISIIEGFKKGILNECTLVPLDTLNEMKRKGDYYLSIESDKRYKFSSWFLHIFLRTVASSILSLLKYLKIILFCKGHKIPLYNEYARHRYNIKLIIVTFTQYIARSKNTNETK